MKTKLKPCKKCGSKLVEPINMRPSMKGWIVYCTECGLVTSGGAFRTMREAVEAWNAGKMALEEL